MEIILNERVLNDDTLHVAPEGHAYKKRYPFMVVYWTFASAWSDREHVLYAKTAENALKRYKRLTKRDIDEDTVYNCLACI